MKNTKKMKTMKTLKTFLTLTILLIITTSCSKDDEAVQEPKTPIYLLSKITYSATQNTKYFYDENNILINEESLNNSGSIFKTTFQYNNNGKLIENLKVPIAGNDISIEKETYSYDSQNRLIQRKLFTATTSAPDEFALDYTETFGYNASNIEYKYKDGYSTFATRRTIFELDQSGNFLIATGYRNLTAADQVGVLDYKSTIEYDDKKNPLANLPEEYVFLEKTKNNRVKSSTPQFSPTVIIATYEYNQDGYPSKSTSGNRTTTFEYIIK
jgi:hypothetical protein